MAEQVFPGPAPAAQIADGKRASDSVTGSEPRQFSKDDIQMWLRFDLGAVSLSLQEIEQLAPGQTLLLTCDPDLPVQLTCSGAKIGHARLVDINGQLGIQVARLHSTCEGGQS